MVKNRKSADADKRAAGRKRGGEDDSYSFDDGGGASESGDEASATVPDLSMDALRKVFHLPCVDAATALGVAHSKLKRRCHKLKIARWPQRKLASLVFLRDALPNDPRLSAAQRESIIAKIDTEYDRVMQDPNHPLDKELEQLRKSNYKLNYNRKLKCAAKTGKRAGSVGDGGDGGSWRASQEPAAGAAGSSMDAGHWASGRRPGLGGSSGADGGDGGGVSASRGTRGVQPPPLTVVRGNLASPTGSGPDTGSGGGPAGAAPDSPAWEAAADDDIAAATNGVASFGNSPRRAMQRRLAAQLGAPGGGAGGGPGGPGRRVSMERTALLSVITDGKVTKQGAASRRQSGSGSGNATPRHVQGAGPFGSAAGGVNAAACGGGGGGSSLLAGSGSPMLRRSLASPIGPSNAGGGVGNSRISQMDGAWGPAGQKSLDEQEQQQQQQRQQQRPGGTGNDDDWSKHASPRGPLLAHGSLPLPNVLSEAAACYGRNGAPDVLYGSGPGLLSTNGSGVNLHGAAPGGAVGGSVASAGVNTILADTAAGGLLLEAMVAGVGGGGCRSVGAEQLSEEELALLGIQGPDRDLILDPTTDNSLDPLLDLLLMGDALTSGGSGAPAAAGLGRLQQSAPVHPQAGPQGLAARVAMQQQVYPVLDPKWASPTLLQQQQELMQGVSAQGVPPQLGLNGPAGRRISDALPSAGGLGLGDFGGGGGNGIAAVGLSSLLRTSASGLPLGAAGVGGGLGAAVLGSGGGGSGHSHSAPLRQHRLSSVSGLVPGASQRPSRFAGGGDVCEGVVQSVELGGQLSLGAAAGAGLLGALSFDEIRYGGAAATASSQGVGDGVSGDLGRRRGPLLAPSALSSGPYQQQPQHLGTRLSNLQHHQVLTALEGRHSAPGQIGIPGWDEPLHALAPAGGSGPLGLGADLSLLNRRMLASAAGVFPPAAAESAPGSRGPAAALQRLAAGAAGDASSPDIHLGACMAGGGSGSVWSRLPLGDSDLLDGARAVHGRSASASGLMEPLGDGYTGCAGSSGLAMASRLDAGSASSLSLLGRREQALRAMQQQQHSAAPSGGSGGPAAVAAALGAAGMHLQPPALLPSPTESAARRGLLAAGALGPPGHLSPPPDTIVSLQGLRLRGEDDRISAGDQPPQAGMPALGHGGAQLAALHGGTGAASAALPVAPAGSELAAVLHELQQLRRQQQLQIQRQQQQIAAQQLQIERLGALSGLTSRLDGGGALGGGAALGKTPQPLLGPSCATDAAAVAAAARQQLQRYDGGVADLGADAAPGGLATGPAPGGLLEAVDYQLTDIDTLMERNIDLLRRNSGGFGSFVGEMRASGFGTGSGSGRNLGGGVDVEAMRHNLRRELRQNSTEQWEDTLRHLASSSGGVGGGGGM